ncbi:secoisolariciresinol dehydrogenase-like [Andrographis paniculata]|uniref:secoisolariciresinol dehydrogenase-like n=1 Tax=Andrographis paniculata TaxID=175694 RepID=UPI0021E91119|nr:secoisolariciresinol dehydrogenase-like [Andrographis paniculata]
MAAAASSLASALKRLEGKVALITGGASGIGESSAKLFAKHGAKVVIADVQDDRANSVVAAIGHSDSTFIHCDVSNEDHIKNAVDTTVSKYGKLDIMFNNAFAVDPLKPRIFDIDKSDVERVLSVNVMGVFLGMKHAARVMVPMRSGSIITTTSAATRVAAAATHAYTCSKYAALGLTKNVAAELGKFGIRANCISPYGVATPSVIKFMGLDSREAVEEYFSSIANLKGVVLTEEDVAKAALFLASEEAKYISGENLIIDGGFSNCNAAMDIFQNGES